MRKKKGQGLSLNVVIIAVILLVVLVLLIFVVGKYSLKFRAGTAEAESSICLTQFNRSCQVSCIEPYVPATGVASHTRDCGEKEVCCER